MKLYEALRFCNEVEKVAARKRKLTLLDVLVICEKFNRRVGKKTLNEKRYYQDGKPQRRISFDRIMELQPEEITIGEKTYPVLEYATYGNPVTTPLTPLVLGDEGMNHYEDFEDVIRKRLSIAIPGFFDANVNPDYIKNHIEAKMRELGGQKGKNEEIRRKRTVPYFWMTLESPNEIWINHDNNPNSNESYVFFKQFEAHLDNNKVINLAMIVVVDENYSVKTYYFETGKNISEIYERRWGAKIFSK